MRAHERALLLQESAGATRNSAVSSWRPAPMQCRARTPSEPLTRICDRRLKWLFVEPFDTSVGEFRFPRHARWPSHGTPTNQLDRDCPLPNYLPPSPKWPAQFGAQIEDSQSRESVHLRIVTVFD